MKLHRRGLAAATGAAAAALTLASMAFAGPAGAATGPAQYTTNSVGYVVTGGNFENVTTTVGARSVAQYNKTANESGFGHGVTLQSKQYTAALGISVYSGDNGPNPWDAAFALYNASSSTVPVASCLAGNNGGSGGVTCNASVTGEPGAFATGPVKLTLSYDPATNLLSFDATQTTTAGVNDFNGSINLGAIFGTPPPISRPPKWAPRSPRPAASRGSRSYWAGSRPRR